MNNDKKFLDKSFEDLLKDPSLNKKDLALDKQDKSAVIYLKVSKIKRFGTFSFCVFEKFLHFPSLKTRKNIVQ